MGGNMTEKEITERKKITFFDNDDD